MVCEHYRYLILELESRSMEEKRVFLKNIIESKIKSEKNRIINRLLKDDVYNSQVKFALDKLQEEDALVLDTDCVEGERE
jgi:uncharacterized protein YpiB (UPF0302 family)